MKPVIILLGAPGSGKGTQSDIISDKLNIPKFSTGDSLRSEIEAKSELGMKVSNILDSGNLVSDNLINSLVLKQLSSNDLYKEGVILDGYPRTLSQACFLFDEFLSSSKFDVYTLYIGVCFDEIKKRILGRIHCANCNKVFNKFYNYPKECNKCSHDKFTTRSDDNEDILSVRYANYIQENNGIINFFKDNSKVVTINGNLVFEKVTNNILDSLKLF